MCEFCPSVLGVECGVCGVVQDDGGPLVASDEQRAALAERLALCPTAADMAAKLAQLRELASPPPEREAR